MELRDSAAALSPDTPPAELSRLAEIWPARVLANPILPLLRLEEPTSRIAARARRLLQVRRLRARLRGKLPDWCLHEGGGAGYGYGYGDGSGYGFGAGYGNGYGDGSGYGARLEEAL